VPSSARIGIARPPLPTPAAPGVKADAASRVVRCSIHYSTQTGRQAGSAHGGCFIRQVKPVVVMDRVDRAWRPNKDGIDGEMYIAIFFFWRSYLACYSEQRKPDRVDGKCMGLRRAQARRELGRQAQASGVDAVESDRMASERRRIGPRQLNK
jgi:hypothetical protein